MQGGNPLGELTMNDITVILRRRAPADSRALALRIAFSHDSGPQTRIRFAKTIGAEALALRTKLHPSWSGMLVG